MSNKLMLEVTYQEVARRLLLKQSEDDISQQMGISMTALHGIMNRKDFQFLFHDLQTKLYKPIDERLSQETRNLRDEIEKAAFDSFDKLLLLLKNSSSEAIAKDVAQDMLDRAGYGKQAEAKTVINIGALEASVLVEALKKEEQGAKRLGLKTSMELTKAVGDHAEERRNAREAADS